MTTQILPGACYNVDFLEAIREMPDKSVDHIITDPPYEAEAHQQQVQVRKSGRGRRLENVSLIPGLSFEPLRASSRTDFAREMVRVSRGWILAFCQIEAVGKWRKALRASGASYKRTCIWLKPNAMPQFSGDRPGQGYEVFVCAWASPGRSEWNAGGKSGVYVAPIPRGDSRYHETQKPFGLMAEIISDFTKPGDLILDPFAGSGTTLVAAKKLERQFIGFEKIDSYCDVANQRISDPLFLPDRVRGKQLSLL